MDQERALELIFDAVDEINGQLPPERRLEKSAGTILLGDGAVLDSLSFISLLVAIEQRVGQANASPVNLLDEVAKGEDATALRTLGTVAAYVVERQGAVA
jgi:acyl carrier protein